MLSTSRLTASAWCITAERKFSTANIKFSSNRHTFSAAGPRALISAWPQDAFLPGMRIMLQDAILEAELIPGALLCEDDAIEWHTLMQQACKSLICDPSEAKRDADLNFTCYGGTVQRGIGGIRTRVNFNPAAMDPQLVSTLNSILDGYLKILGLHTDALAADKTCLADFVPKDWVVFRQYEISSIFAELFAGAEHLLPPTPSSASKPDLIMNIGDDANYIKSVANAYAKFTNANPSDFHNGYFGVIPKCAYSLLYTLTVPRTSYVDQPLYMMAHRGALVPRPPVWLHRQAGRYLPEYLELRRPHTFLETIANAALCAEITIQPVRRYGVDVAIIFSDIMAVPIGLGQVVEMIPGPFVPHPIATNEDIDALSFSRDRLKSTYDAIRITRDRLHPSRPLCAFSGGPWTLLVYMTGNNHDAARRLMTTRPAFCDRLMSVNVDAIIEHLSAQVEAGADALQVFESHGGEIGHQVFVNQVVPHLAKISVGLKLRHPHVPLTLFPRNATSALEDLVRHTCFDAYSLDHNTCPRLARMQVGPFITLQGNLDPETLYCSTDASEIANKTREMINAFGGGKQRYIANLGHGTRPDMNPEAVGAFVREVQTIRLGTRRSELAMSQAKAVADEIERGTSTLDDLSSLTHIVRLHAMDTRGDLDKLSPVAKILGQGDKGLYTAELEDLLSRGQLDIVQHSLKDLSTDESPPLCVAATLFRENRSDALVLLAKSLNNEKYNSSHTPIPELKIGAKVGTSALRRMSQLQRLRPDLKLVPLRGNILTRVKSLYREIESESLDAIVLAYAGLKRLGLTENHNPPLHIIELATLVPAVGQGAVAVQARLCDRGVRRLLANSEDINSRIECDTERAFLRAIDGGCLLPVGVRCTTGIDVKSGERNTIIDAHIWSANGDEHVCASATSAEDAAKSLLANGGSRILAKVNEQRKLESK